MSKNNKKEKQQWEVSVLLWCKKQDMNYATKNSIKTEQSGEDSRKDLLTVPRQQDMTQNPADNTVVSASAVQRGESSEESREDGGRRR